MFGDILICSTRLQKPFFCRVGIGHSFLCGKCFGSNDEQSGFGVQVLHNLGQMIAIYVGYKMNIKPCFKMF